MNSKIDTLLDAHSKWLRKETTSRKIDDDWVEITTPYLDRHNDMLQIYAKCEGNGFLLSDDGYVIDDLLHSGCKLESPKRELLLNQILSGFGIFNNEGRLEIETEVDDFPAKKHCLIQAMLAVNEMFMLSDSLTVRLFQEDVATWLDENKIHYVPDVKFTGLSGYENHFEFAIPKTEHKPERILQSINRPSRDAAASVTFRWIDAKNVRKEDSIAYAILNDIDCPLDTAVEDALKHYEIRPILWSEREHAVQELAA